MCLLLIQPAATARLGAQSPRRPALNPDRIHCGVDTLEVYLVRDGTRKRTGMVIDECRVTRTSKSQTLTRIYRSTDLVLGNRLDTIVDSWTTLEPRSFHSKSTKENIRLDWGGGRVHGTIALAENPETPVNEQSKPGVYNSASFDLLLRASPLMLNYSVSVPAFLPTRGLTVLTAKVVGEEILDGRGTWRVDADFDGMAVSFWIAKDTRQLLKQVMHAGAGADIEFRALAAKRA